MTGLPETESMRIFPIHEGEGGLLLLSIRTSHQVRPESGLPIYEIFDMKACRITTLFRAGERKEEEEKEGGHVGHLGHITRLTASLTTNANTGIMMKPILPQL